MDTDDLEDYCSRQAFSARTRAISGHQKVVSKSSDGLHATYFAGKSRLEEPHSRSERRHSRSGSIGSAFSDGDYDSASATTSEGRSQRSTLESQPGTVSAGSVEMLSSADILKALSMTAGDDAATDGDDVGEYAVGFDARHRTRASRTTIDSTSSSAFASTLPSTSTSVLTTQRHAAPSEDEEEWSLRRRAGVNLCCWSSDSEEEKETMALLEAVADGGYDERVVAQAMSPRGRFISACLSNGLNPRAFMIVRKHEGSTHLALSHMRIGDKVAALFASPLKEFDNIESIDMNDNKLTDVSLGPLVTALAQVSNLQVLDLGSNNVGTCVCLCATTGRGGVTWSH
jgi:hypothetical protein